MSAAPTLSETAPPLAAASSEPRGVHLLVPANHQAALRELHRRTRVPMAAYLRESAEKVLAKHADAAVSVPLVESDGGPMVSIVFRLPSEVLNALKALSQRTRVRQSEYLREGLRDLLVAYGAIQAVAS